MAASRQLAGMPTWLFHGLHDDVVPASCSLAIADCMTRSALSSAPAPKLTLYPGVGHDSWTPAYAEPELPGWFLSHRSAEA